MIIARKSHLFDQLTIKAGRTNTEWNTYQSKYKSIADLIDLSWRPIINQHSIHQCFTLISHASNHINHLRPFHLKSAKGNHILLNYLFHICYRKLIYYLICHFVNPSNTNNHLKTYKVGGKRELNSLQISFTIKFVIGFNHLTSYSSSAKGDLHLAHQRALHLHTIIYNKPMKSPLTQLIVLKLILSVYSSNSTN